MSTETAAIATAALERTLNESLEVFSSLTAQELEAPSACAGWSVRTVLAHVTQSLAALAQLVPLPPSTPGKDFESELDAQAREFARRPDAELLDLFRSSVPAVIATFGALPEEFAAMPVSMGSAGTYPFRALADALTFDHTCHIRWDVLQPRGPVRRDLPELDEGRLLASVRWLMRGVPQMTTSRFRELVTDPLDLVLVSPGATFRVEPEAATVTTGPSSDGPARATVHTSAADFIAWGTGRQSREGRVRVDGDAAYAERLLTEFRVY
jgi:uncharacterized protein (TIGR03083 family)